MNNIKIDNYYKPESKTLRLDKVDYTIKPSFTTRKLKQLQQENQKLKERIEYLERSNNRREDTILELRQEIYYKYYITEKDCIDGKSCFTDMKNKSQEIIGVSDDNKTTI